MIAITDLITVQQGILGEKWLEATKDPEKAAHMVDMIADHLSESMKVAYQRGLEDQKVMSTFITK